MARKPHLFGLLPSPSAFLRQRVRGTACFAPAVAELQERDTLTSVGLTAAMIAALGARGVPGPTAVLADEVGALAFKRGFAEWSEGEHVP